MAVASLMLGLVAAPVICNAVVSSVEKRFARANLDEGPRIAGFIALGGGKHRIAEAMALARSHPKARLVISGDEEPTARSLAESGIGVSRLLMESKATNTYENAIYTARLLGPATTERWVLVTSASHMPRAIGSFRQAGLTVDAWPVADPPAEWSERLASAIHEWGGLFVYWLQGKTESFFPSPDKANGVSGGTIESRLAHTAVGSNS